MKHGPSLYQYVVSVWALLMVFLLLHFQISVPEIQQHEGVISYYVGLLFLGFPVGYAVSFFGAEVLKYMQMEPEGTVHSFYLMWSLTFLGGLLQWTILIPVVSRYLQDLFQFKRRKRKGENLNDID